jgi:tol-pal system protein YbgF
LNIGCVFSYASSQNVNAFKGDVAQLRIEYRDLKQDYADLYAKIDSYLVRIEVLNSSILDLQNKISVLTQIVQDFEISVNRKMSDNSSVFLSPSSIYRVAYSDYSAGKFELACSGFQSFVDNYPEAELASQAQFYIGECFYSRNMWLQAIEEYKKVEEHYKESELLSSAKFKIALCYELLGEKDIASNIFSSIVVSFPQSSESLMAKEKLIVYENGKTK